RYGCGREDERCWWRTRWRMHPRPGRVSFPYYLCQSDSGDGGCAWEDLSARADPHGHETEIRRRHRSTPPRARGPRWTARGITQQREPAGPTATQRPTTPSSHRPRTGEFVPGDHGWCCARRRTRIGTAASRSTGSA
ncbi:hypothetical protein LTR28_001652, partial [Elasticomyces elasticus]